MPGEQPCPVSSPARCCAREPARRSHDGFASLVVLALAGLVVLVAGVLVALGSVSVTRARAASAADQGALAAAAVLLSGPAAACRSAGRVVTAAGAVLVRCHVEGEVAEVEVSLRPAGALGGLGQARGLARAGPAALG